MFKKIQMVSAPKSNKNSKVYTELFVINYLNSKIYGGKRKLKIVYSDFAPKMKSNTCYITKSLIIHGNTFFTRLTKIVMTI